MHKALDIKNIKYLDIHDNCFDTVYLDDGKILEFKNQKAWGILCNNDTQWAIFYNSGTFIYTHHIYVSDATEIPFLDDKKEDSRQKIITIRDIIGQDIKSINF